MGKAEQPAEEITEVPGEEGTEEGVEVEEPVEEPVEEDIEENVEEVEVKDNTEPFTRSAEDKRTWRVSRGQPLQHQR